MSRPWIPSPSTLKEVVDERRIRELPLNGRDATQLVLLLPGVYGTVRDNSGLRQAGSGRGIVQAGVASNGARGNMVNYMLDGTTHNDTYTNVALAFPNPDALQEFSVQTNNFSAESGRTAGAVVTAVTKSGTNSLHGSSVRVPSQRHRERAQLFCADARRTEAAPVRRNIWRTHLAGPHLLLLFPSGDHAAIQAERCQHHRTDRGATERRFFGVLRDHNRSVTGQPFPGKQIPLSRLNPLTKTILDKLIPLPTEARTGLLRYSSPTAAICGRACSRSIISCSTKDTLSGRYLYNYYSEPANDSPLVFATRGTRDHTEP